MLNFKGLDDLYISDGTGSNASGGSALKGDHLRYATMKHFTSNIATVHSLYPFVFADNLQSVYTDVHQTGYFPIDENNVVYYVPDATASDQIEFVSIHFNTVYIKGSTIIVEKSQ